jgi:predicted ATPase
MLTRIEIDGFKTFEQFALDLGSFMVILGANASGKSNLFDAVQLLSNLATKDLREATQGLRGEVHELFRTGKDGVPASTICFAVEVLVEPLVKDPWGSRVELSHTRIRYEVTIERRQDERGIERLVVSDEKASPILGKNDPLTFSAEFREAFLRYARRSPWLTTTQSEGKTVFEIHQDGKAGRTRPTDAAEATVLSSITTGEFPHLFALREEMRSWRFLQLDPAFLRRPSPINAPELLQPDGSNLAFVLARIKMETKEKDRPKGVLADIAAELATIIPGVTDLDVDFDQHVREYRIDVSTRDGNPFTSRVLSDGTLRVLALLAMLYDPKHRGLVCFEEPENGVHPARLRTLIQRLRELVTDPLLDEPFRDEPLTQLVMNSHSPVVLSALSQGEHGGTDNRFVFADLVTVTDPRSGEIRRKTRIRKVRPVDQGELLPDKSGEFVTKFEVERYLSTVNREE